MHQIQEKAYSQKLWKRIQRGDVKALSELFESRYLKLYNYGCKMINQETIVEDAIQDIFISIWNGHHKLADVSSVESYLLISLRRRLLRLIEKERKISRRAEQLEPEITFNPGEFYFDESRDEDRHKVLAEALNELPPRRKEAIYLHFYNGMDYAEISQIMDLSIQTVRNYISHALIQVREILNERPVSHILISVIFGLIIPTALYFHELWLR